MTARWRETGPPRPTRRTASPGHGRPSPLVSPEYPRKQRPFHGQACRQSSCPAQPTRSGPGEAGTPVLGNRPHQVHFGPRRHQMEFWRMRAQTEGDRRRGSHEDKSCLKKDRASLCRPPRAHDPGWPWARSKVGSCRDYVRRDRRQTRPLLAPVPRLSSSESTHMGTKEQRNFGVGREESRARPWALDGSLTLSPLSTRCPSRSWILSLPPFPAKLI